MTEEGGKTMTSRVPMRPADGQGPAVRHRLFPMLMLSVVLGLLSACSTAPERAGGDIAQGGDRDVPDAVPKAEPRSRYGNPASYVVFGKRYYTKDDGAGHVERGLASWYGPGFHGRKTSSGERYDMHAMTAAHKTLPLPTYAQVTNLDNGRSAVVRINDRGPFHGDRVIDLSRAAAAKLGVLAKGTAKVEVRALEPVDRGPGDRNPFLVAANKPQPQAFLDGFEAPGPVGQGGASPGGRSTAGASASSAVAVESRPAGEVVAVKHLEPKVKARTEPVRRRSEPVSTKGKMEIQVAAADTRGPSPKAGVDDLRSAGSKGSADRGAKVATADRSGGGMYLQVGAFGNRSNAEHLRQRLAKDLAKLQVQVRSIDADAVTLYKVQVGPFVSRAKANDLSQQLAALGVTQSHVVVE
jgi:rare lipoprotein A